MIAIFTALTRVGRRFLREDRGEGSSSSGLRIGLAVAAIVALIVLAIAKVIIPAANKGVTCTTAVTSVTTAQLESGTGPTC